MAKIPNRKQEKKTNPVINQVKAGFTLQGTSLNAYCSANNIDQGNASKALLGIWSGKKGQALRNQIIQASKPNKAAKTPSEQIEKHP